ncbi:MAG: hypothetical protein ACREL4_10105 [Gemmatimonadales bacterium]
MAARQLTIVLSPEAKAFIAAEGYDPVYGARPLKRVVQQRLQNPLALAVLDGTYHPGDTIKVGVTGKDLSFKRQPGPAESASA